MSASEGTILVVDDEPDTLRFLTDALEAAGYTVLVATSGAAAIQRLSRIVPDLILMDGMMPEVDGFEATRRIKETPAWCAIPIMFMTGLTGGEHAVAAFGAGGADYVRKPIELDELLARARLHIARSRAMRAAQAGLDATLRQAVAVGAGGRFLWCSPLAEPLIARFDARWTPASPLLPAALQAAIQRLVANDEPAGAALKLQQPDWTLELSLVARYHGGEALVRLNEVSAAADVERLRNALRLTQREAEVLLWISYGKPNRVISDVLGISPRTVHKHLERIFDKLGVETRSAAAATAIRMLGP